MRDCAFCFELLCAVRRQQAREAAWLLELLRVAEASCSLYVLGQLAVASGQE